MTEDARYPATRPDDDGSPVALVLVHWNQPERCATALDAWEAQTVAVDVVVVDNGSTAEHRARLHEVTTGRAAVVDAGDNLGFGPGANVGLRRFLEEAAGEWVVVAPHDALPAPDCLAVMARVLADRPGTGLACADVGDDHLPVIDPYFGGMSVPAPGAEGRDRTAGPLIVADRPAARTPGWVPVGYPHGTLLMARRGCLADIGLFDERYFAYCEEADLGQRARSAGWDVALVRGAEVRNPYLGGDATVIDYLMLRNTLLLVRDHFGRYRSAVRTLMAVQALVAGLLRPRRRPWIFVPRARLRALLDHARGRYGPPPPDLRR